MYSPFSLVFFYFFCVQGLFWTLFFTAFMANLFFLLGYIIQVIIWRYDIEFIKKNDIHMGFNLMLSKFVCLLWPITNMTRHHLVSMFLVQVADWIHR